MRRNNAGSGTLCAVRMESIAPDSPIGTIDPTRALNIAEQFHISRQFWATLVEEGKLDRPHFRQFRPHMSLVMNAGPLQLSAKTFRRVQNQNSLKNGAFY